MGEFFEQYPLELLRELAALRAHLSERDREIERLTATIKREMGEDYLSLQALYIQKLGEVRGLEAKLSASQAREREAVERAEALVKNQSHIQERIQAALGNGTDEQAWEPGEHWLMAACRGLSALAAARKALEDLSNMIEAELPMSWTTRIPWVNARAALNGYSHA